MEDPLTRWLKLSKLGLLTLTASVPSASFMLKKALRKTVSVPLTSQGRSASTPRLVWKACWRPPEQVGRGSPARAG